jgi:hypothetical protein
MSETINIIIDKNTKRKRKINCMKSQEIIKSKLTNTIKNQPLPIYEDDNPEKLRDIRNKLIHNDNYSYCIRKNKIYQCRKKQKKIDVIRNTIKNTLKILYDNEVIINNDDNLELLVFNDLLNGSKKPVFTIKN